MTSQGTPALGGLSHIRHAHSVPRRRRRGGLRRQLPRLLQALRRRRRVPLRGRPLLPHLERVPVGAVDDGVRRHPRDLLFAVVLVRGTARRRVPRGARSHLGVREAARRRLRPVLRRGVLPEHAGAGPRASTRVWPAAAAMRGGSQLQMPRESAARSGRSHVLRDRRAGRAVPRIAALSACVLRTSRAHAFYPSGSLPGVPRGVRGVAARVRERAVVGVGGLVAAVRGARTRKTLHVRSRHRPRGPRDARRRTLSLDVVVVPAAGDRARAARPRLRPRRWPRSGGDGAGGADAGRLPLARADPRSRVRRPARGRTPSPLRCPMIDGDDVGTLAGGVTGGAPARVPRPHGCAPRALHDDHVRGGRR